MKRPPKKTLDDFVPDRRLDVRVLTEIYGFPIDKIYVEPEIPSWLYWIPSGKPRRTHRVDEKPVPEFGRDQAFLLVDKICFCGGPTFHLSRVSNETNPEAPLWMAEFADRERHHSAVDRSPGIAICQAALLFAKAPVLGGAA